MLYNLNKHCINVSFYTSAYWPSAEWIRVTVISFFVNVPVLSEHITVAQPRKSNPIKLLENISM